MTLIIEIQGMNKLATTMTDHHRYCDELFAGAESAANQEDWDLAQKQWKQFCIEFREHIDIKEEQNIFPEVEKRLGPIGPIMVMKHEHEQMRQLAERLTQAIITKDKDSFLGQSESLMILMQQHNMKEEQILYPLIEQHIPDALALL